MDRLSRMLAGFAVVAIVSLSHPAFAANDAKIINPQGGEIRALIIGINAYQHVRQLKGAVADARDLEATLKQMGVQDITSLVDEQVDRASVLRDISALVSRTNVNDLVFLSIAGHGAQEPERIKGSEPDGMENVFLLPGFENSATGSTQRILSGEFNHFIKQFELRGAKVIFVADTCHGGGMARSIDPRSGEMSFRQIAPYKLVVDTLTPVVSKDDPRSELDLDRTAFLAAVDRSTKSPEVHIPGVDGLRGALSYAVARAIEGNADADGDGKITLKELFSNVRQVVYQLSDQRQNVVTETSPNQLPVTEAVLGLTRGVRMVKGDPLPPQAQPAAAAARTLPTPDFASLPKLSAMPIRLAALDGAAIRITPTAQRDTPIQNVNPTDNPDLIWDPASRDVIAWGDVVAYNVDQNDLLAVIDRTAAIRELKRIAIKAPQAIRVYPDDRLYKKGQTVEISMADTTARALLLFNISGDGTIQMLYPVGSDRSPVTAQSVRLPLRVREPFGAEQVVAITSQERPVDLEKYLSQLNGRRASIQAIKLLQRYSPADARIGSVGFFTSPVAN